MAIAIDTTTTVTPTSSGNFSHTCSGSQRFLAVVVHLRTTNSGDSVSVTYNSVAMTSGVTVDFAASGSKKAWIFYLVAPASGANSVAYSFTGAAESVITAISFTGVDQATGVGNAGTPNTTGSGTSVTSNITTTAANSWVLDAMNEGGNTPFTPAGGQTQQWGTATTLNGMTGYGSTKPVVAAGATSTSWSWTGATSATLINLEIKEGAGGAVTVRLLNLLGVGT